MRWGVFGILGVAALLYAYNASKKMAESHGARPAAQASAPAASTDAARPSMQPGEYTDAERKAIPAHCRTELDVARRAVLARDIGEPLDRLLRIQDIAWQEDPVIRARLTKIATEWYGHVGAVDAAQLQSRIVGDCT